MSDFDLIIRNGEIFDGTGAPPLNGDIAVRGGRIVRVGGRIEGTAGQEVDATGLAVTPGFVDVHTHYDGQATWSPHLDPSSSLGTTTVVVGNCGVGFAPCRPTDRQVLVDLMEGVEEIPGSALAAGIDWNWESFPQYLDALEAKARDIDIAVFLPHGPLRVYVMGARGVRREPATAADLERMQALVGEAMAAGAVGLSSSRTFLHRSSSGDNVPSFEAAAQEMKALGRCLSGDRGHVLQFISDFRDAEEEFGILRDTSVATGAKGTFTLIPIEAPSPGMNPDPQLWRHQLRRIEAAQAQGLDIRGQVISRPIGILMGHGASMSPFYRRPSFEKLAGLPPAQRLARLRDPAVKAQILSEHNRDPHIFVELLAERFDQMYPLLEPLDYLPQAEQSVLAHARRAQQAPIDWLYDYLLGNDAGNLIYIAGTSKSEAVIAELLSHPHTISALGDGGAHVGSICDSSANLHVLTRWVRERGVFDLARGIRMITREPAGFFSLHDRGTLAPGMKADLNLIDIAALNLRAPHTVDDLPGGGRRFLQRADGLAATFVSGQMIYRDGVATGALPGRLVRGMQAAPA